MANKKYNQPIKSKKSVGSIIAATACVLALAVGASAIGVGTSGFKDWSFSRWFPKGEVVQTTPEASNNGGATVTDGESNGMVMAATAIPLSAYEEYGITELAENAFSLSVTYTPANTTFQQTTYTAKFADGTDCSAFATVTQSTAGSKDAVLTVLKPFSQQIIVTATNNRDTKLKATSTVEFICTTPNINVTSGYTPVSDGIFFDYNGWSNGTLTPETAGTITFVYDVGEAFVAQAAEAGFTVNRYYTEVLVNPADSTTDCCVADISYIYHIGIVSNYASLSETQKADYNQFLGITFANYSDGDSCGRYGFSYSRVYNGVTYSTYDITQDESAEWQDYDRGSDWAEEFEVKATSMSTDTPIIIAS